MIIESRARSLATQGLLGHGPREFYADGDPARGTAVVGLHGFTGTAAEIRPVLERLAADGHAVDGGVMPGHGTKPTDLQRVTFDDWVADARRRTRGAIERHGRVVLVGFSLGSLVAMQVASEVGFDLEIARGLAGIVVLGNALTLTADSWVPLGLVDRLGMVMPDAYLVKPRAGDLVDPANMDKLVTYDRHPLRAALEVYRAGLRVRPVVSRITCPILALHGRRDHVCPWSNAPWLARHSGSPDVTVRIFEQSAHVLAWDGEREAVAEEAAAFARRVLPAAQPLTSTSA